MKTYSRRCPLGLELHKAEINLVPLADASGFPLWYHWGLAHHISHTGRHFYIASASKPRVTHLFSLFFKPGEITSHCGNFLSDPSHSSHLLNPLLSSSLLIRPLSPHSSPVHESEIELITL
jgi:hypothetical protein